MALVNERKPRLDIRLLECAHRLPSHFLEHWVCNLIKNAAKHQIQLGVLILACASRTAIVSVYALLLSTVTAVLASTLAFDTHADNGSKARGEILPVFHSS